MEETNYKETNYKDVYIEKLEKENQALLEMMLKKDKIHAIVECVLVGLLCIVMFGTVIGYFFADYAFPEQTTIQGDNNSNITDTTLDKSTIDEY